MNAVLPKMSLVRQSFDASEIPDLGTRLRDGIRKQLVRDPLPVGSTVAIGVGSRGVSPEVEVVQVLVQELERSLGIDRVRSVEPLDFTPVTNFQFSLVEETHFCKFPANRFIGRNSVIVAALDHERSRCNEPGHLRIVEGTTQIPLKNLILTAVHVLSLIHI